MRNEEILHIVIEFVQAMKAAQTIAVPTMWDEDGQILYVGDEKIMGLWTKIWDELPKHTIHECPQDKFYYFRNDNTLYYMWSDAITLFAVVCEYWGWIDGKQVFQLMDIEPFIKSENVS